jgi:iron complex transport system substrate-binding protein
MKKTEKTCFTSQVVFKKVIGFLVILQLSASLFSQRIISLAPGLTEIVFALGRGSSLVGVTKFCDFPAAAKGIKKIGGFLDINREALVALAPDIVLTYPEHSDKLEFLRQRTLIVTVRHKRLSELLQSILDIGQALHVKGEAMDLVASIQGKMHALSMRCKGKKRIRTLLIAGRNAGDLKSMYIIGKNDFLNDLLEIAGGTNAYNGKIEYPNISLESVIFLAPEFIFEISAYQEGISDERIHALWRPYGMIPAVVKNQIRIVKDSFWLRPGPRVGKIVEEMALFFSNVGDSQVQEKVIRP